MAEHDPRDRDACADYLRDLADKVESGDVESVWAVAMPVPESTAKVEGYMAVLGPTPDGIALAKLFLLVAQQQHVLLSVLNHGSKLGPLTIKNEGMK